MIPTNRGLLSSAGRREVLSIALICVAALLLPSSTEVPGSIIADAESDLDAEQVVCPR
jgi:hypothetical protein